MEPRAHSDKPHRAGRLSDEVAHRSNHAATRHCCPGAAGHASAQAQAQVVHHRVQRGETLYDIARRYGASVENILQVNGLRKAQLYKSRNHAAHPENIARFFFCEMTSQGRAANQRLGLSFFTLIWHRGKLLVSSRHVDKFSARCV